MNPLVKGMLEATISNDVETRLLEDLFEHEAKCETKHTKTVCSLEVTHYYASCAGEWRACWNSIRPKLDALNQVPNATCDGCERPIQNCWTIRPI